MGLTSGFSLVLLFLKRTSMSLTDTVVWNTSFYTGISSLVEPDGNSSTRGRRAVKLWSTHTCGAQLSTGFPGPG